MTSVWPALCPPWKRTTMSACSDSQSTILPFPSSPHWDPTTTTLAMRRLSSASATPGIISKRQRLVRHSDPHRTGNNTLQASRHGRDGASRPQPNCLILRVLFTPCRRAPLTTADDLALSKAISRQHRGGERYVSRSCAARAALRRAADARPTHAVALSADRSGLLHGRWARRRTKHRRFKQSLVCVRHLTSVGGGVPHAKTSSWLGGSHGKQDGS